jgi:HTH-type transcriptional regulator / antitoxin HigA
MLTLKEVSQHYTALCTQIPLKPLRTKKDYERAVAALNNLMDAGVGNEKHPLADLLAILGDLIGAYEQAHLVNTQASPAGVLRFLMAQHGLAQTNLPEVGSQGVVSEILAGKRTLNLRQIRALAQRFSVSPTVFLEQG